MTSRTLTAESKSPLPDIVIVGGGFAGIVPSLDWKWVVAYLRSPYHRA